MKSDQRAQTIAEAAFIGCVVCGPLAFGAVEPWSRTLILGLLFAGTMATSLRGPLDKERLAYTTLLPGAGAVFLLGVLQLMHPTGTWDPWTAVPTTVSAYGTRKALGLWAAYIALIVCIPHVLESSQALRRMLRAVFLTGCAVSVIGIIQMAQSRLAIYGIREVSAGEPFGPYYNRNHAASLLIMSLFCGVGLFWEGVRELKARTRKDDRANAAAQLALTVFGIILALLGVLFALSRGALAAMTLTGFLACAVAFRWKRITFLWAASALGVAAILVRLSPIANRINIRHLTLSTDYRMSLYAGCLDVIQDFPWLGTGLGAFQEIYYPYQSTKIQSLVEHAHSDWLELLVQIGLVGFLSYIVGLLMYLKNCLSVLNTYRDNPGWGLYFGANAAVIAFMLHGFVEFGFQIPANGIIFVVLLASLGGIGVQRLRAGEGANSSRG